MSLDYDHNRRARSVSSIPDADLLRRAVRDCARDQARRGYRVPVWSVVSRRFALGSTFSIELCQRFDVDPEQMVRVGVQQ